MMKKQLFGFAMKGEWDEVMNFYEKEPLAHKARITRSGDTALHIAVSNGLEVIVELLVTLICKVDEEHKEALGIKNERGNTPLHLAASMGSVRMCMFIANEDSELVGARNEDGETPFFLAALHGNRDAFLCLQDLCDTKEGESYGRRKDGDTIIHCAISGDHFDLAYRIILRYHNLVNSVNEKGITPLHLLANKPSAFRSGSHLSWLNKIIYHCIFVDELKADRSPIDTSEDKINSKYPLNYQTCINFFRSQRNVILGETPGFSETTIEYVENPEAGHPGNLLFPSNYDTCFDTIKFVSKAMLVFLGLGPFLSIIKKLRNMKERNTWSVQIMNELLLHTSLYEYEYEGKDPDQSLPLTHKDGETTAYDILPVTDPEDHHKGKEGEDLGKPKFQLQLTAFGDWLYQAGSSGRWVQLPNENIEKKILNLGIVAEEKKGLEMTKRETPILIAAKNGVTEMVEKILELFPVAINDVNPERKNLVLLAVENRQPHVYQLLLTKTFFKDIAFRQVDIKGNNALHVAATLGKSTPWLISGAALHMQWEIKWYEFIRHSLPSNFTTHSNKEGKTPEDLFTETHKVLVEEGSKWLAETSNACSLVATIIISVTFATSATVPGGIKEGTGVPLFEEEPAFIAFAISSLISLCFSVFSAIMFLSIMTSRHRQAHFGKLLPRKFLLALTSLLISIVCMLVAFCSSHFFVLRGKLKLNAYPVYAISCLVATLFVVCQFQLYFDFIRYIFSTVPERRLRSLVDMESHL